MTHQQRLSKYHYIVSFKDAIVDRIVEYQDESDLAYGEALYRDVYNRPYIIIREFSLADCIQTLKNQNIPLQPTIATDTIIIHKEGADPYGDY
jgi:hypothetical protein